MKINLLHLSYERIGQIANEFLKQYRPKLFLPIPIEEIAEAKLHLEIIPHTDLKRNYDVDGFLTSNLNSIFIDFNLYLRYEKRARFTIAHEIGHLVLHGKFFQQLNINSLDNLNNFATQITDEEYGWMEYQAYSFASQVLVPSPLLFSELKKRLNKIPELAVPEVIAPIAQDLLETFQVSGEVMLRRLQKEKIVKSA